jgi:hypothetical protein
MKRKPDIREKLTLRAWAQASRTGFSIPVVGVDAFDTSDVITRGTRTLARKCLVVVRLPGGQTIDVTREDLDPVE